MPEFDFRPMKSPLRSFQLLSGITLNYYYSHTKTTIMKKHFILMVLLIATSLSYSQNAKFGLQAGATYSKLRASAEGQSVSTKYKMGLTAGIFLKTALSGNFMFRPELNFT